MSLYAVTYITARFVPGERCVCVNTECLSKDKREKMGSKHVLFGLFILVTSLYHSD